ncbi:hypothetical protein DFR69_103426 [Nocardia neocaledoniensis]|uniref:Uncharacterized protein n=1 Tax=Nocardia neocaledoniensis TaxID=236511 RepID=A0A317NR55_9NOCA|nr:hypothetical protein [Nocardia neocaledoniensis]PWV77826.1 hypothetical protein DFR69_103426 [Nocardia neocaledoniensis]
MTRTTTYNTPTGTVATTTHDGGFSDDVLDALGRLLVLVVTGSFRLIWWALLFPVLSLPAGLSIAVGWWLGWPAGVGLAGVAVAGMVLWRLRSPQTFERWCSGRIRSRFLAWFRYRRRWVPVMAACSLAKSAGGAVQTPRLISVHIGDDVDTVKAKMLAGHAPDDWCNRSEHLAHAFGSHQAKVAIVGPSLVELAFRRSDALAEPVVVDVESVAGFKTLPGTRKAA